MVGGAQCKSIHEILEESEINQILKKSLREMDWKLLKCCLKPAAADGISGFLGDHYRVSLQVKVAEKIKDVHLFMKTIPKVNKPKADFIINNNIFARELLMFKILDELQQFSCGPELWCAKCYLYNDSVIVMPDMCQEGYSTCHYLQTLDLQHVLVTIRSVARLHSSYANYETQRTKLMKKKYDILQEYGNIVKEFNFLDCPWLRTAAKLSADFIQVFSAKYKDVVDLEGKLLKLYLGACESLRVYEDSLNTLIHKDLWVNNIMFKYDKEGLPVNSLIIDFQCIRYGPPAFDVMIFLYLCTSRKFREENEKMVLEYYYSTFIDTLNKDTKDRIDQLDYDKEEFLSFCELSRMFGLLEAIAIAPYVFMDPEAAQKTFDNPETFVKYTNEDRSEPVISYCKKNKICADRHLELCEEFVERFVLNMA